MLIRNVVISTLLFVLSPFQAVAQVPLNPQDLVPIVNSCPDRSHLVDIINKRSLGNEIIEFDDGSIGIKFKFNNKNLVAIFDFDDQNQWLAHIGMAGMDEPETFLTYLADLQNIAKSYVLTAEPDLSYRDNDKEIYRYIWKAQGCIKIIVLIKDQVENESLLLFFVR